MEVGTFIILPLRIDCGNPDYPVKWVVKGVGIEMNTTTVDVGDIQTRFLELLSQVLAGDEIVVTQGQKPVARLLPVEHNEKPRIAGLHAGLGWVSDDFDDPLPDEFWVSEDETSA